MDLRLDAAEAMLVRSALERALGDLQMEIAENKEIPAGHSMHRDEERLKSILGRLGESSPG